MVIVVIVVIAFVFIGPDQLHGWVIEKALEDPHGVGASANTGVDAIGQAAVLRRFDVDWQGLGFTDTDLDELAEHAALSCSLDEACLLAFRRRELSADQTLDVGHGRALEPAGIDGVYAAVAPDGRVMALLEDSGRRTKSVVVIRPATLD